MGVCSAERRTCWTCQGRRSVAVPRDNSRYDVLNAAGCTLASGRFESLHLFSGSKKKNEIATIVRNRAHDILMRRRTIPLEEQFNELRVIRRNSGWPTRELGTQDSGLCSAARSRPFLLEASKHRKMNWRVCARRKPR